MARLCLVEMLRFPRGVHIRSRLDPSYRVVAFALWVLPLLSSVTVHAQDRLEVPGYREAVADALAEYEARNYLEARTFFERAHKLYPNARTLRGLAVVAFELRSYSESAVLLEQALASLRKPLDGEMRAGAEQLLQRARGFIGELKLAVKPDTAQVLVDGGQPTRVSDRSLMLDVGPHVLEFRADGFIPERRSFAVHGGEREAWEISLSKESQKPPERPLPSGERALSRMQLGLGIAAVGVGAAGLVTAGVLTISRHREGDRYRSVSPDDGQYPQAVDDWEDTRPGPYIAAAVGAVTLGTGAVRLVLGAPRRRLAADIAAGISGAGGIGLTALAIVNLKRGGPCDASLPDRPRCSDELEQLDRGAIFALSAAPLLAISLAQLFRRWPDPSYVSSLSFSPRVDPVRSAASFDLSGTFL